LEHFQSKFLGHVFPNWGCLKQEGGKQKVLGIIGNIARGVFTTHFGVSKLCPGGVGNFTPLLGENFLFSTHKKNGAWRWGTNTFLKRGGVLKRGQILGAGFNLEKLFFSGGEKRFFRAGLRHKGGVYKKGRYIEGKKKSASKKGDTNILRREGYLKKGGGGGREKNNIRRGGKAKERHEGE